MRIGDSRTALNRGARVEGTQYDFVGEQETIIRGKEPVQVVACGGDASIS